MPQFSFMSTPNQCEQVPCYITHTSSETKELMQQNLHRSPLFSGQIEGIGPRYCPSIEDKFKKFPDKKSHLLYLLSQSFSSEQQFDECSILLQQVEFLQEYILGNKKFSNRQWQRLEYR